jgi:endo-1,4-beta-xylanase
MIKPLLLMLTLCTTVYGEPPEPSGSRLRTIVEKQFPEGGVYIGGTTGWNKLKDGDDILLNREFSTVCPENDFKQHTIHPSPGIWNWRLADHWIQHIRDNNQVLRIHGPISPQCSPWTKNDARTAEELRTNLNEFMTALCERYNGKPGIRWMDVVNETVLPNGSWFGPKDGTDDWENPWPLIGFDETHPLRPPLYIKQAFEISNHCAPDIQQIINQHGGMQELMWEKIKATVFYLREHGLRVDGIGWQAHIDVGWENEADNLKRLTQLIRWAHDNRLSFHITEMNVWLDPETPDYEAQARTFSAVLNILLASRHTGEVSWNTWNLSDVNAWEKERHKRGCIFFDDRSAKPAYYAIQKVLLEAER